MALGYRRVWLVRRRLHGRPRYVLRWLRTDGRMKQRSLLDLSAQGRNARVVAQRLRAEFEVELNAHGDPDEVVRKDAKPFGEFVEQYIKARRNEISASHLADMKHALTLFGETTQVKTVQRIHRAIVRGYIRKRLETISRRTANRDLRLLHRAFRYAIEQGHIPANPAAGIRAIKVEDPQPHVLDDDDMATLLKAGPSIEWKAYIWTLATTGIRRSEGLRLSWGDVVLGEGQPVAFRIYKTKSKKSRLVPICPQLAIMLDELNIERDVADPNAPIFHELASGRHETVTRRFAAIAEKAGVNATLQDLRRTYATNCARHGMSPYRLQKLLGHSTISVTEKYYLNIPDADILSAAVPTYAEIVTLDVTPQENPASASPARSRKRKSEKGLQRARASGGTADAPDLKSDLPKGRWGFESPLAHH